MSELVDIRLDEFGDFAIDASGDVALCEGVDVIKQDISSRVWTIRGTCPDTYPTPARDPGEEYGFGIQEKLQQEIYPSVLQRWRKELLAQLARDGRYVVEDAQIVPYRDGLLFVVRGEYEGSALEITGGTE